MVPASQRAKMPRTASASRRIRVCALLSRGRCKLHVSRYILMLPISSDRLPGSTHDCRSSPFPLPTVAKDCSLGSWRKIWEGRLPTAVIPRRAPFDKTASGQLRQRNPTGFEWKTFAQTPRRAILRGASRQLTPDSRAQRRARRDTPWSSAPGGHQQVAATDRRKKRRSPIYRIRAITSLCEDLLPLECRFDQVEYDHIDDNQNCRHDQ